MVVLGIESSCDDTAIALVNSDKAILCHTLFSQIEQHKKFGGVVPEIAARSHIESLPILFRQILENTTLELKNIDAIAATAGPGLIGGLIVGTMFAKGLSAVLEKPFIPINHLEGHALTARLTEKNLSFPYLLILASGGHTQILIVKGVGKYKLLATTLDDAIGETFDKVAKMLGLGYPGGKVIEQLSCAGDPHSFVMPKPMCDPLGNSLDFSFSGLKTAVKLIIDKHAIDEQFIANICASLQHTIAEILLHKLKAAILIFAKTYPDAKDIVIAGGVASNNHIRSKLKSYLDNIGYNFIAPPHNLCVDNAAMIAWAGIERLNHGYTAAGLDFSPKARWSLDSLSQY